jgi:agmatinase
MSSSTTSPAGTAAYRLRPSSAPALGTAAEPAEVGAGDFVVIGVPYGSPYRMEFVHSDAAEAPREFRRRVDARFGAHAERYDFELGGTLFDDTGRRLLDVGDVVGNPRDLDGNGAAGTAALRDILDAGAVPLVLGGDDSVPIVCARAFAAAAPCVNVLQIDAHIDFADQRDGRTDGFSSPIRRMSEMGWVGQIVQVGARGTGSATPDDVAAARAAGNVIITADDVHDHGVGIVVDAMRGDLPWFVSFDVDGLDPTIAPGTSCPLPGGLLYRQARDLLAAFGGAHRLAGIGIFEHFPSLDVRDTTSLTLGRLLFTLVGHAARRA